MKRLIALVLVLLTGLSVGAYADDVVSEDAVTFARTVTQTIADMGDNPDVGNRSSGSPAEKQAAGFIEQTMKDIGLQNDGGSHYPGQLDLQPRPRVLYRRTG